MTPAEPGRIVLVGTPIGNLGDLSPRALDAIAGAGMVFCEDTRRTRVLLSAAGVGAPPLSTLAGHNESAATARAVAAAAAGATVAVVSDAGMPGLSDPGERLVAAAVAAGVEVTVVPGPTAAVSALVLSGLPAARWCFEGFLPRRGAERESRLRALAAEERTSVVYESPRRVGATLADLAAHCGPERRVAVAREITKRFEQVWRGTLEEAVAWAGASPPPGEWVLVIAGAPAREVADGAILAAVSDAMEGGASRSEAARRAADLLGVGRRRAYQLSLGEPNPPRSGGGGT